MRYRAFISYSHADEAWARWLVRRLETYRVPPRLVGREGLDGPIGARLGAVFRDRDELTASGDLGATIRSALDESSALIVLCSPAAAASRWVGAEVQAFRDSGRGDRILAFVVAGEPGPAGGAQACFPPALTAPGEDGQPVEPLAADARRDADGRERAFLKLVAGLLGVSFDQLAQREAQRRQRRLVQVAVASLAGMTLAIGLASTAWVARNDAQRRQAQAEDILGFMLGDLREKLTTVGRLDLMRAVDDKAAAYFANLDPRDLSDRALEEQARSLTGIGQVRLDEGDHAEAMAAFREAHARSTTLHERQPDNGQRLFDLAQAEYWIGLVALEQGHYDETGVWFRKYLDSALRLVAMDPDNFEWQKEVAYGHHNLAVLDDRLGRYAEAEQALVRELVLRRAWVKQRPNDTQLQTSAANTASWLGSIAARQGRLEDAEAMQSEAVHGFMRNVELEPKNSRLKELLNYGLALQTEFQAQRGRMTEARASIEAACAIADALVAQDATNQKWQLSLGKCHWWKAILDDNPGGAEAITLAETAEAIFASAYRAEPNDQHALLWLSKARSLLAQIALANQEAPRAHDWLVRAHAELDPAWQTRPSESLRIVLAHLLVLGGGAEQLAGNDSAASKAWRQSVALLIAGTEEALPFERLDPLLRAQTALEDLDGAARSRQRLDAAGYQPLYPFAAGTPVAQR